MIKNHEGRPSGCAYATFEKAADYEEALKKTMSYIGEFTMLYIILSALYKAKTYHLSHDGRKTVFGVSDKV